MTDNDFIIMQRNRKIVGLGILTVIVLMHILRVENYLDGDLHSFFTAMYLT